MTNMFHTISFKNIFFIALVWIISHSCQSDPYEEKHNVYYRFTVLTTADPFPPFRAVGVYDDREFAHYSNEVEIWLRANVNKHDRTEPLPEPYDPRDWYKDLLRTLSNCTHSHCSELHVLQRITGCKLEKLPDGTVKSLTVYDEYGFDGEDFISFNFYTMQWIDKSPKAKETKEEWDLQTGRNQILKHYLEECVHTISTYNNTNMSRPDIYVFARKAPDDDRKLVLTCLATGFYPRAIEMYIRLDRNILEDQISSGIRPNDDETFQMRNSVKIDRNYKVSYDCLLIHSSLTASVEWVDGRCLNCEPEPRWSVIGGTAAVLVVVVVLVSAAIYCCYNRRNSHGRVRNPPSNGAVSVQIQMTSAASADVTPS
ncbi:zinc-alpha-2-glycoprotein-like [Megalobrama amblycephala]|uniref:zinc-alpha-2-glycoprotein-like n=1 Tax=Megalobrama amblycephala TaxID=75352 RepID=UPI0020146612|nr:zinc-alpha-2-glycoprotein-like [Megalobrama amblycephala]